MRALCALPSVRGLSASPNCRHFGDSKAPPSSMVRQSLLFNHLRRLLPCASASSLNPHFLSQNPRLCSSSLTSLRSILAQRISPQSDPNLHIFSNSIAFRSFSSNASSRGPENDERNLAEGSAPEAELLNLGFDGSGAADGGVGESWLYSPVRFLISVFDGYHDLTNFPW